MLPAGGQQLRSETAELQKYQETVRQFGVYWLMVNHVPPSAAFATKAIGVTK